VSGSLSVMPSTINRILHGAQSTAIVVGAIVLAVTHRIPWDSAAAIVAGLGGAWSGVAGAVLTLGRSKPVTTAQGATAVPAASATPDQALPSAEHEAGTG
jgi:hypothetical protein